MAEFLIGYDIRSSRRLQKVYKKLLGCATPIQYSLFLFVGSDAELTRVFDAVKSLIDPKKDDLRCYPLPKNGYRFTFGKKNLPDGIFISGLPSDI